MKIKLLLTFFVSFQLMVGFAQRPIQNGQQVIEAMYGTYKGRWYKNLTFIQQTTFYKQGQVDKEELWYEAMDLTQGLVIKFNRMDSGSGLVFQSDSQYVYKEDVLISKVRKVHELLVLGFSVYFDEPKVTLGKLMEAGYDVNHFAIETVEGKPQYVVGDPESAQFWIDAETMLFTKLRKNQRDGTNSEIYFNDYQKLGKTWIETEVVFYKDGQIVMREVYTDLKTPKRLPSSFYRRKRFREVVW